MVRANCPGGGRRQSRPLSEDRVWTEVKKEALEKLRPYLCDKVIAERHFDLLRAKKILSKEDTEEISHVVGSRRKAGKLLDHLMENPKGLDTLVSSIRREGTQNFLVQKITDEVQRIKNDKLFQKGVFLDSEDLSDEASKTNNLSQFSSTESNASKGKEANILFHPEGEFSPLPSACPSYCPLPSAPSPSYCPLPSACPSYCPLPSAPSPSYCLLPSSPSLVKLTVATLPTTTSLPRPGDPGAPPLPPDLQPPPTGPPNTTTDSEFLPLRSRSP
ncbi:B-cell lymphoma/leukemia 10 [Amblyraja radiata]|uniref:B-cell lymphoma/leukemia 10 n=1 Tax=Amblyraja radiata TaxID=386614 RepID=UPI0014029B73|nr:B-cell lymphoma/leukemia 10 [Amblyraja radiata]